MKPRIPWYSPPDTTENHQVLYRQRRRREAVALSVVGCDDIPNNIASLRVEGDDVRVKRAEKNFIAQNREPTIHSAAARSNIGRHLMLIKPDRPAGAGIEGKGTIVLASWRVVEFQVERPAAWFRTFPWPRFDRPISRSRNGHSPCSLDRAC